MSGEAEVKHSLEAMAACTLDDIVHWTWSIELVNSQVFQFFFLKVIFGYIFYICAFAFVLLCRFPVKATW